MECPEAIDLMGDALDGALRSSSQLGFDEHLAECRACGTYFEQLRITTAVLRGLPPGPTSPHRRELLDRFRRASRGNGGPSDLET